NERFDNLVRTRMKQHWEAPPVRPGREHVDDEDTVVLQFIVDRQGWISDVQVANSSGIVEFDNSAVKAALRMNSIPEIGRLSDQAYLQIKAFRLAISPVHMK
ncbi:TPA: energy transducer TonB, partial [Pseudomonas aeruginosa]|nr:energy transducer TonB [Pseudomonas aeruginosa]